MPDEYPKRPKFFALRFARLMAKDCLANQIGPEACWLLAVIAHTEDAKGYRAPVTFFNEQLMPLVGCRNVKALDRVRDKAVASGWLHYEAGGKSKAGRYWVVVPERNRDWDDHPTDEHEADDPTGGSDYSATKSPQEVGKEAGEKRERSGQQSGREAGNIPPVPSPSPNTPLSPPAGGGEKLPAADGLTEAIAEVTGADPATNRRDYRRLTKGLRSADPPYTPAEVREFGRRFPKLCTWAVKQNRDRPTLKELGKNIGLVRVRAAPRPTALASGAATAAERERQAREAEAAKRDRESKGIRPGVFTQRTQPPPE